MEGERERSEMSDDLRVTGVHLPWRHISLVSNLCPFPLPCSAHRAARKPPTCPISFEPYVSIRQPPTPVRVTPSLSLASLRAGPLASSSSS